MRARGLTGKRGNESPEAIETYAERVDCLAAIGGNPAYAEAAALVARMAVLRDGAEQAAYIAALKGASAASAIS